MKPEQVDTLGGFALLALSCGVAVWTGSIGLGIAAVFTAVAIIGLVIRATKKAPPEPLEEEAPAGPHEQPKWREWESLPLEEILLRMAEEAESEKVNAHRSPGSPTEPPPQGR